MPFIIPPKHFIDGDVIGFDTEGTGLDLWHGDKPFGFSFANMNLDTAYFEFDVDPYTREPIIEADSLGKIQRLLEDPKIKKVVHNRKYDRRAMQLGYGIDIKGPLADTMIKAFVCNTREPALGAKQLGDRYCGIDTTDQQNLKKMVNSLRRTGKKHGWNIRNDEQPQPNGPPKIKAQTGADYWVPGTMARCYSHLMKPAQIEPALTVCKEYAVKDVERCILLDAFYENILDENDVRHVYEQIEMELWEVIYEMETRGPMVDCDLLGRQMEDCVRIMNEIIPRIEAVTWPGFRPKTDEHVRTLFYQLIGFPVDRMTKGGKHGDKKKPAVDKYVILAHLDEPIVRDLAIWKANHTAFTTFYSKYRRLAVPDMFSGGMALHCDYRQVGGSQGDESKGGVATGRLSSSNPNLQNVMTPENTSAVHPLHVRPAFIPRPGYCWLCIDYEGMEVRMFAAVSHEPTMMKAIHEGRSIHDEMTNSVWGGPYNEDGIKQAIRVLSLDGTGQPSDEVYTLWAEWGITHDDIPKLSYGNAREFTIDWLKRFNWDVVRAEQSVRRKNIKTAIKTLTFLRIYGGGAAKAALVLKCTEEEAARVLHLYDTRFPRVREYSEELISEAKANGYIRSQWGRRLEINPEKPYQAVNYMIQGSSADLMKVSLVRIHRWLKSTGVNAFLLLTIHDEIVTEVGHEELTKKFIQEECRLMSDTQGVLPIEMTVEPKVVLQNWSIKHKVNWN